VCVGGGGRWGGWYMVQGQMLSACVAEVGVAAAVGCCDQAVLVRWGGGSWAWFVIRHGRLRMAAAVQLLSYLQSLSDLSGT
jgi:hypothetical protein